MDPRREDLLIQLLSEIGTNWSPRLYNTFAPHFALSAIEVACFRCNSGVDEVHLVRRSEDDQNYANQWHSPGSMLRASDNPGSYIDAFSRTCKEMGLKRFPGMPKLVRSKFLRTKRGPENAIIHCCTMSEPAGGQFFPVQGLPKDLIAHHFEVIRIAYEGWLSGE